MVLVLLRMIVFGEQQFSQIEKQLKVIGQVYQLELVDQATPYMRTLYFENALVWRSNAAAAVFGRSTTSFFPISLIPDINRDEDDGWLVNWALN